MEYREWGYGRDPRDRVAAQSPWSDAGDPADEEYDDPRPRSERPTNWDGTDQWATARYPSDTSTYGRYDAPDRYPDDRDSEQPAGAWSYGHQGTSWDADGGWLPQQRRGEADDEAFAAARRWGEVLDHDDWYERPPRRHDLAQQQSDDEFDADDEVPERGYLGGLLMTAVWYVVPIVLYLIWSVTLASPPGPDCVDPAGNPCPSPRAEAINTLSDNLPRLATAFVLSLAVALIIRLATSSWRAVTVGFAAAVVGAGIATVAFSLIGGGPTPT